VADGTALGSADATALRVATGLGTATEAGVAQATGIPVGLGTGAGLPVGLGTATALPVGSGTGCRHFGGASVGDGTGIGVVWGGPVGTGLTDTLGTGMGVLTALLVLPDDSVPLLAEADPVAVPGPLAVELVAAPAEHPPHTRATPTAPPAARIAQRVVARDRICVEAMHSS
jgi:hypothetical protein